MKKLGIILLPFLLWSCSQEAMEEFAFKKTLEMSLTSLCGEEDTACIEAVETQITGCMEKSNWRQFLADEENPEELERFTSEFYACVVDENGDPYFTTEE